MSSLSRFNPKDGIADFWHEFRKPNPLRWPILVVSCIPLSVIFYWLSTETVYKDPERPSITYISTYETGRSDEEIVETNLANQEVKDLREAEEERIAERKRDLYKALGSAAGMDVDRIAKEADERRTAEEAAEAERRAERFGRDTEGGTSGTESDQSGTQEDTTP